jgi:hypothetical protein
VKSTANKCLISSLVLCSVMFLASGCRHNINTSNPAVVTASALGDASNACKTVEDALTATNHALEQLETVEPEYYAHVKPLVQRISQANRLASAKIVAAKNGNAVDWKSALTAVGTSINLDDLRAAQVKNPTSQIIVGSSVALLIDALVAIH